MGRELAKVQPVTMKRDRVTLLDHLFLTHAVTERGVILK